MSESLQILRTLRSSGSVLLPLDRIGALQGAANIAAAHLPIYWEFDPSTPPAVADYLVGVGQGAVEGGLAGLSLGLLLGTVFPPVVIGYAVAGGAILGGVKGTHRVSEGWRVRVIYHWGTGRNLLKVSLAA